MHNGIKEKIILFDYQSNFSGTVWTARCKFTGDMVAVKRMAFNSQPKKEMLLTEIKVMQQYKHKVRREKTILFVYIQYIFFSFKEFGQLH